MSDPPFSLPRFIEIALSSLALVFSALVAFMAISEITVRQDLCKLLEEKTRLLAEQFTNGGPVLAAKVGNQEQEKQKIEALRGELEALMIVGARGRDRSAAGIADRLLGLESSASNVHNESSVLNFLGGFNSDYLLAIALAACGLFGSIVSELRTNKKISHYRHALLGLAAGFITLISIKGGRAVFLIEHRADLAVFNPYSSGLVALLAGLYSEKAYRLLSKLVQLVAAQVVAEKNGGKNTKEKHPALGPSEAAASLETVQKAEL